MEKVYSLTANDGTGRLYSGYYISKAERRTNKSDIIENIIEKFKEAIERFGKGALNLTYSCIDDGGWAAGGSMGAILSVISDGYWGK